MYPAVSKSVFAVFSCRDLSPNVSVLRSDSRITCESDEYEVLYGAGAVVGVLFVFGLPFFWLVQMLRHQTEMKKGRSIMAKHYGFLVGSYKPEFYMWEVSEMYRKVILTGVVSVVKPGSMVQISVASVISLTFLVAHAHAYPFKDDDQNQLKLACEVSLMLVLLGTALLRARLPRVHPAFAPCSLTRFVTCSYAGDIHG